MKHFVKFYCALLFYGLLTYVASYAGDIDKNVKESLNKELLDTACSGKINPSEKYNKLATLLKEKADIATTHEAYSGEKVNASVLALLMRRAAFDKRDDDASIKLLIESKSPLNSWSPRFAPLRIAIQYSHMHSIIPLLVAAQVNVTLEPQLTGRIFTTYVHDLAHVASCGENGDSAASWMFSRLSPLGNIPGDELDEHNRSAMHISQSNPLYLSNFASTLARLGANLNCAIENCDKCSAQKIDVAVRSIHQKWKAEADKRVLTKIPVKAVKELVIDYCFGKSDKKPISR